MKQFIDGFNGLFESPWSLRARSGAGAGAIVTGVFVLAFVMGGLVLSASFPVFGGSYVTVLSTIGAFAGLAFIGRGVREIRQESRFAKLSRTTPRGTPLTTLETQADAADTPVRQAA